jgi:excisionase family DNA binding protein
VTIDRRLALPERLLTPAELADVLGVTRKWLYAQVEEHGMPAYRFGRKLAFELPAVRRWLETRRIGDWAESCDGPSDDAGIPSTMDLQDG